MLMWENSPPTPRTGQAAIDNVRPVHVELCLQVGQSRIKVGVTVKITYLECSVPHQHSKAYQNSKDVFWRNSFNPFPGEAKQKKHCQDEQPGMAEINYVNLNFVSTLNLYMFAKSTLLSKIILAYWWTNYQYTYTLENLSKTCNKSYYSLLHVDIWYNQLKILTGNKLFALLGT